MRGGTRKTFLHLALAALVLATSSWLLPIDAEWNAICAGLLLLAAMALGSVWYLSTPKAAQAPDILKERLEEGAPLFESDGMTFAPRFEVRDGVWWLDVFYQNRFTGGCRADVSVVPMEGWSPKGAVEVPPVVADIDCAGGEVGVVSYACPIAAKWQGKLMIYDVYAHADYPGGRGEQLREEAGRRVGGPTAGDAVATAALLMVGHVHIRGPRAGKMELRLPEGVAETLPDGLEPQQQTLWRAGNEDVED
jgi:hypothetical protein